MISTSRIQQERLYSTLSSSFRFFITRLLTEQLLAAYSSPLVLVFSQFHSLVHSLPLPTDLLLSIADAAWFLLRRFPSADTLLVNTLIQLLTVAPLFFFLSLPDRLRETQRPPILARVFAARRRRSAPPQGGEALPRQPVGAAAVGRGWIAPAAPRLASSPGMDAVHVYCGSETHRENGKALRSRTPVFSSRRCVRRSSR